MDQDINFEDVSKAECEVENIRELNRKIVKKKNLILCVNIRSLNANFEKIETFVESMSKKPCVIICTETWIMQHPHFYQLHGYKLCYNESKINRADGVLVYIMNNIYEKTKVEVIDRLSVVSSNLKLQSGESLRVSAIYRCHDVPKTEFLNSVKKFLSKHSRTKNHCIIGDYNIDIIENNVQNNNIGAISISQEFLNNFFEQEFIPYYRGVTRPSPDNESGSCIDNCFAKTRDVKIESFKLCTPFNDHYPLVISIDQVKVQNEQEKIKNCVNYRKLKECAKKIEWNSCLHLQDPNLALDELIKMIHSCVEKATCNKKTKNNQLPRKKWITKAILVSCKNKENLYNIWKRNPTNITLKHEYKNYEKILNKTIKDAKYRFENNEIRRSGDNPRQLWSIINSKMGKSNKQMKSPDCIVVNNQKIVNKTNIANEMNDYFSQIGIDLSNQINNERNDQIRLPARNSESIFIQPTNICEIHRIISEMKKKAGGVDNINASTIK